jgi:hypothetical protein
MFAGGGMMTELNRVSPEVSLVQHLECTYILNNNVLLIINVRTVVDPEIKQLTYFT